MAADMTGDDASTCDMLRDTASRLLEAECQPRILRDAEQGIWPAAAWAALEEAGLHRAMVPEAAGGFGVSIPDALSLLRVTAEYALPLPLTETMLAGWLLAQAGVPIPDGPLTVAPVTLSDTVLLSGGMLSERRRGCHGGGMLLPPPSCSVSRARQLWRWFPVLPGASTLGKMSPGSLGTRCGSMERRAMSARHRSIPGHSGPSARRCAASRSPARWCGSPP